MKTPPPQPSPSEELGLTSEEEEELARRLDEIPELDRQGRLRPVESLLAALRSEIRQRRGG